MIGHPENREEFLAALVNNPRDVFVKFLAPSGVDQVLTPFDGENDLNIYLGICISHR